MVYQIDEEDVEKSGFFGYNLEDIKHYSGKSWDNFAVVKSYERDKKIVEKKYRKATFFERLFGDVLIQEKHN